MKLKKSFRVELVIVCKLPCVQQVPVQKNGKVKAKDLEWGPSKKILLTDIDKYIENLKFVKSVVDESKFPVTNREEIDPYLKMDFFTRKSFLFSPFFEHNPTTFFLLPLN